MPKSTGLNRELILAKLSGFYRCAANVDKLRAVIDGRSRVSLRLLDYFVTSYSKRHNVSLPGVGCVYGSYCIQLKAFSKHNFDPFRRRGRINYFYNSSDSIETTIGQLNFFKWAIDSGVLDFVEQNAGCVEADMTTSHRSSVKQKSPSSPPQKRPALAAGHLTIASQPQTIYFN